MAGQKQRGAGQSLSLGFIFTAVVLIAGLGIGLALMGQRAYRRYKAEQAQGEMQRRAHRAADSGRQLLTSGDLVGAARQYLQAYTLGNHETGVRFLLPWLQSRLGLELAVLPHEQAVSAVAFSLDGQLVLTGSRDLSLRIFAMPNGRLLQRFVGHRAAITGAWFRSDGQRVLSLAEDSTCRLFPVEQNALSAAVAPNQNHVEPLATLTEPAGQPWLCRFSPDGQRIVTVASDTVAHLWDGTSGKPLSSLGGHSAAVLLANFSSDGQNLITAAGKTAFLWDAQSGQLRATLSGHSENIKDAVFSPDGSRIVTTSADQTARLWDGKTGQALTVLIGHSGTVYSATFTLANGKSIMTISADGTARLWDSQTGRPLFLPVGHPRHSQILALSRDGSRMVIASESGTLELWDRILGHMRASLSVRSAESADSSAASEFKGVVAFSPSGRRIVTGGTDGIVRIWDGRTGQALYALRGHRGPILAAAWNANGSLLITGSGDGTVRIWRSHIDRYPRPIEGHQSEVTRVAFSADGSRLLSASRDGSARIWEVKSGDRLLDIEGSQRAIDQAFFTSASTPEQEHVVTVVSGGNGSAGRTPCVVRVIDSRSGQIRVAFGEQLDLGRALAVSKAGDRVITAPLLLDDKDKAAAELHALSPQGSRRLGILDGHTGLISAAAFSADGELLATAGEDHSVRLFEGKSGRLLRVFDGHSEAVRAVVFAPDGKRLLTGSADRTARIFATASAASLWTLGSQVGTVRGVYYSPDGERVLTVDSGERAWLWSSQDGRLVAALSLARTSNKIRDTAVFSPDGTRLASIGQGLDIYDGRSGLHLTSLLGDGGDLGEVFTSLAFSPDGQLLATGTQSGAVKLWDVHLESRTPEATAAELDALLGRPPQ